MMKTSKLVERISEPASKAWEVGDRAFDLINHGKDIIHLGIGDPDFDTPSRVVSSLKSALQDNQTHYSPVAGGSALRQEIAVHANVLYGDGVEMENVSVLPGAQAALFSSFLCITDADDEVIALEPTYATYPAVIQSGGATLVTVKLDSKSGSQINIEDIKAAITSNTKAILINSPSNPSGAVFNKHDLNALSTLCNDFGLWLVSAEGYWSLL